MPELPEVVVTLRGVLPHIEGKRVVDVIVRNSNLRWPVPNNLFELLNGQLLKSARQRGKYMLFEFLNGHLMVHLGMSGNLKILLKKSPPERHDHVDIVFNDGTILRYTDPRRFGSILWVEGDPEQHRLLKHLGPEPLKPKFDAERLHCLSRGKTTSIKQFLMDNKTVVGVGNIYANETLFLSGIRPKKSAGRITLHRYKILVENVREVLSKAIDQGRNNLKRFFRQ